MTVLTPAPNPSTILTSTILQTRAGVLLSPALTHSLYFAAVIQQLLSTTTTLLFLQAYLLSSVLLRQTYYAASVLLRQAFLGLKQGFQMGWKRAEWIRKRLFFEFMVFILGGGNGILLLIFWPGWIVVGAGFGMVWCAWG